jgi:RNA 2',3'-cyclic 3'-phosphodiesterase
MRRTRTFIGIDVGPDIRSRVAELQQSLAASSTSELDVKWVEKENLHVTLLFLGELDDHELVAVCRALTKVTSRELPIPLTVSGVGAFPNPRRPKVLWAGITEGADELTKLHAAIAAPLLDLVAYRREERAFTPHLTLGRINSEESGTVLAAELPKRMSWDGGQTMIDEVLVFSSDFESGRGRAPTYTVIARATLDG